MVTSTLLSTRNINSSSNHPRIFNRLGKNNTTKKRPRKRTNMREMFPETDLSRDGLCKTFGQPVTKSEVNKG